MYQAEANAPLENGGAYWHASANALGGGTRGSAVLNLLGRLHEITAFRPLSDPQGRNRPATVGSIHSGRRETWFHRPRIGSSRFLCS
jgi:hypothetical protein